MQQRGHKTKVFVSIVFSLWLFNVFVIKQTLIESNHSVKDVKKDPLLPKSNYFGDTEKLLVGYQTYGPNIKMGKWNKSVVELNPSHAYNKDWERIIKMLRLPPGCNAVDIGANDGDNYEDSVNSQCFLF